MKALLITAGSALISLFTIRIAYPEEAKLNVQFGHPQSLSEPVQWVSFSPFENLVLTSSRNLTILWDAETGREIRRIEGDEGPSTFSSDGKRVLTGGRGSARLWDVITGNTILDLQGVSGNVDSVAFSPNGARAVTFSRLGDVAEMVAQVWRLDDGHEVCNFRTGRGDNGAAVSFSSDQRVVTATTSKGGETLVQSWDPDHGTLIGPIIKGRRFAAFSADRSSVTTYSEKRNDRSVQTVDLLSGKIIRQVDGPVYKYTSYPDEQEIGFAVFSPQGEQLLTLSEHGTLLWDVRQWRQISVLEEPVKNSTYRNPLIFDYASFSPNGNKIALISTYGKPPVIWDVRSGEISRLQGSGIIFGAALSPDGNKVLIADADNKVRLWDLADGKVVGGLPGLYAEFLPDGTHAIIRNENEVQLGYWDLIHSVEVLKNAFGPFAVSPNGKWLLSGSESQPGACIIDLATKEVNHCLPSDNVRHRVSSLAVSKNGEVAMVGFRNRFEIWQVDTWTRVRSIETSRGLPVLSSDGAKVAFKDFDDKLWIEKTSSGEKLGHFDGKISIRKSPGGYETKSFDSGLPLAFSPNGQQLLIATQHGATIWDLSSERTVVLSTPVSQVTTGVFLPNGTQVLTGSNDGSVRIWDVATRTWLVTIASFPEGKWAVVSPDGRFDTNSFDAAAPLHWIVDSDPMHALPLEIFMRDYYTPRLLPRILAGENLPNLAAISEIKNRVQPRVEIVSVVETQGIASVRVTAASRTEGKITSGLQDLRLFRDGQLVAFHEGPLQDGVYDFPHIALPTTKTNVVFTAYAFNSAKIKSRTASRAVEYKREHAAIPKAFVLAVGINHYQADGCELQYAANDAHKLLGALTPRLRARGFTVQPYELISTTVNAGARKAEIRSALEDIAQRATPDDAFILTFSGHGYTSEGDEFFLLPSNIRGTCKNVDQSLLENAISAEELSVWLRGIDAGEMVLIIDSCFSAKSVEANDFKPGPMGNRGLGQLAYDKKIRILTASQADQAAFEDAKLGQGLLTYILTEEGLARGKADWKPTDSRITVGEWLSFAVSQVPRLTKQEVELPIKGVHLRPGITHSRQLPALFDFAELDQLVLESLSSTESRRER